MKGIEVEREAAQAGSKPEARPGAGDAEHPNVVRRCGLGRAFVDESGGAGRGRRDRDVHLYEQNGGTGMRTRAVSVVLLDLLEVRGS